jgi:DNA helicase-2/ATP-dependent DNA helicase PcrA
MALCAEHKLLPARALTALEGFRVLIDELDTATDPLTLEELVDTVVQRSGLIEFHRKRKRREGPGAGGKPRGTGQCRAQLRARGGELSPLQQFVDSAALDAGEGQADPHEDSVQLMTLHSAKGLEFPAGVPRRHGGEPVSAPYVREEPGSSRGGAPPVLRRHYPGHAAPGAHLRREPPPARRDSYNSPSRFVREIPADLLNEVRLQTRITRPVSRFQCGADGSRDTGLSLGQRVYHQMFGEGVVLNFEGAAATRGWRSTSTPRAASGWSCSTRKLQAL